MSTVQVKCPNCSRAYSVDEGRLSSLGRCKQCGRTFAMGSSIVTNGSPAARSAVAGISASTTAPGSTGSASASVAPASSTVPKQVGRFLIKRRLGAGTFGAVYLAFDPILAREVALKIPHAGTLQTPRDVERFHREGRTAAGLHHPSIVPVHDAGSDGDVHYIAAQFIPGRTLAAALEEDGPLDPDHAARIIIDLADALHYAHRQGIVHRDVKPVNVMLNEQGQPLLMDFGLARAASSQEKLTHDGAILGTPAYMAPEQARSEEAGPASDQYALGTTLYELLTGHTPFSGPPQVVLFNAIHTAPEPPRAINPAIPLDLETIALKALSKAPADRYADCAALADDLRRAVLGEPTQARPPGPLERLGRWYRRNKAVATVSGVAASALIAATVFAGAFAMQQSQIAHQEEQAAEKERSLREEVTTAYNQAKTEQRKAEQLAALEHSLRQEVTEAYDQANAERDRVQQMAARMALERGISLAEQGDVGRGLNWMARALTLVPASDELTERSIRTNLASWEQANPLIAVSFHSSRITSAVAFSPDGQTVLTGSDDNTARLWRAADGSPIGRPMEHESGVNAVAFSPDGQTVLTGSTDKTARLWPIPRIIEGDSHRIELWTQVITGLELDEGGGFRFLISSTWQQRRKQLDDLGGPPVP